MIATVAGILFAVRWPFRESAIIQDLEEAGSGKVEIRNFRQTYFPHPGCIAEGVTYRLGANAPPFATFEKLTIQSNLLGLLGSHIRRIRADGLHVYVPPKGSKQFNGLNSASTQIDEINIYNAILDVPRREAGKPAVQFGIYELILEPASATRAMHFSARLSNPEPPGEIVAAGSFGPWLGVKTPVTGDYTLENANLGAFRGISGILSSQGTFSGILQHINVAGKINIPGFEVTNSEHPVALNSEFSAYVDGINGDTFLNQVSSEFLKTTVASSGKIAATPGRKGKTATIDLEARNGRIEDILRMFTKEARPPMAGEVSFKGKAVLPPGTARFLRKIEMAGDFGISDSNFTRPSTQEKVNQLSQNAQTELREHAKSTGGKKEIAPQTPPPVLSDLRGHVALKNGTATFSNLSFYIPGAHAKMHGTYNLISDKIDMHGTLKMDSDLSDTAHGAKALILKVLDPFFKKKRGAGSDIPVKVSGDYHHPSFGMDVQKAGKRLLSGGK
ncbi:MAG: AsmA-like C-terminal region-containing protein [Terriglobales bacterium]